MRLPLPPVTRDGAPFERDLAAGVVRVGTADGGRDVPSARVGTGA